MGAVAERPVVGDGAVVARPTLPVVLGADHRIIDGDLAEAFRRSVVEDLTEPLNPLVWGCGPWSSGRSPPLPTCWWLVAVPVVMQRPSTAHALAGR